MSLDNRIGLMASLGRPWYEEQPARFEEELRDLTKLGYTLDKDILDKKHIVVFRGQSMCGPGRIEIWYPNGFPSSHPSVVYTDNLIRHQRRSGLLCVFGFRGVRWRADMTALETVLEAEALISRFGPGQVLDDDDLVPEPRVLEYPYEDNSAILVPPPFPASSLEQLKTFSSAKLRMLRSRAILTALCGKGKEVLADSPFRDWWLAEKGVNALEVPFRALDIPPPYGSGCQSAEIYGYLKSQAMHQCNWSLLAFPDEWGTRLNIRPGWIGAHTSQDQHRSSWVRAFLVSADDRTVRTEFAGDLQAKKVLLAGCGSLGSGVGVSLAQEGVGTLYLVDYDRYEPGNAIRHQVSMKEFGLNKAVAVKKRIEEVSPLTHVDVLLHHIGGFGTTSDIFEQLVCSSDAVVDATADPATTHFLNRLCVAHQKILIVGSVTNGAWSTEVFRYRPGSSGCWMCFRIQYGAITPPGAPNDGKQFAPGCNQPTFVGGASSMLMASGFVARIVIDTLTVPYTDGDDYFVWYGYEEGKGWRPRIESHRVPPRAECAFCGLPLCHDTK